MAGRPTPLRFLWSLRQRRKRRGLPLVASPRTGYYAIMCVLRCPLRSLLRRLARGTVAVPWAFCLCGHFTSGRLEVKWFERSGYFHSHALVSLIRLPNSVKCARLATAPAASTQQQARTRAREMPQ